MSTSCVYPLPAERVFAFAEETGFDGVEIMVTNDDVTRDAQALRRASAATGMPILSIHAPVLLLTHFVWGRDPKIKLERSAELAVNTGADTVVVHPPFRWQRGYAERFLDIVRETAERYDVHIAVENMFPWKVPGRTLAVYAPGWDPRAMDCEDVTFDFSHAALSGVDARSYVRELGPRLRHVHLCDGTGPDEQGRVFDEHLLPGQGGQPVAETLQDLAAAGFDGHVVAEVNLRKAKDDDERRVLLTETLEFARTHLGQGRAATNHLTDLRRDRLGALDTGSIRFPGSPTAD